MRIAVLQFAPRFAEVDANLDHVESMLEGVEADVIVLPELFQTGYLFTRAEEMPRLAEPVDGPTTLRVATWAKRYDAAITFGLAESAETGFYNSALIVGPDKDTLAHYRKIHLFDREKEWFDDGDLDFPVVDFRGARLGLMVCFDWRFPESARTLAFRGADLILHPSNLVLPWCPDAMITRALENNVFIATSDRWGIDAKDGVELRFIGRSQVVDPRGQRLASLGEEEDGVLVVDIDVSLARDKQVTAQNNLNEDLRPEFYVNAPQSH